MSKLSKNMMNVLSDRIIRVVIYARYSCSNQTEQSIEGQLADCERFAKQCGFQIVDTYIDRALTATTDRRPQFQQMIKDSEKGVFDVIIVWKLDRFARNRYDSAIYKQRLRANGVRVMSAMENIDDSPEGALMESVLEGFAEYFSRDLSQKVQRGMRETAKKHKITGLIPYGYKKSSEGTYIPDENTASAIIKIFEMYANGERNKDIVNYLNTHGYKTASGSEFRNQTLYKILSYNRYTGHYSYGGIEIHDENQRIISDDLFNRVQSKLAANRKLGGCVRAKEQYILTPKLYCGYCKNLMYGESGHSKHNVIYNYYKCKTKKKGGKCEKKTVRKHAVEDAAIDSIIRNCFNNDFIQAVVDILSENIRSKPSDKATLLKGQLESANKKIANLLNALENGIFSDSTQKRLSELEQIKKQLEYDLSIEQTSRALFDGEGFKVWLNSLKGHDFNSEQERRCLVDNLLYREYLWNDKVLYIYKITPSVNDENLNIDDIIHSIENHSDTTTDGVPERLQF